MAARWEIHQINGKWEIQNGELRVWDGEPISFRLRMLVSGDVRVEFDCHQEGSFLSDASCFIGALPFSESKKDCPFYGGYLFQYGGFANTQLALRAPERILWHLQAVPLIRGKRYHILAEKVGERVKLLVDGRIIFNIKDPNPLIGAEHAGVGFYAYGADTYYDNVRVYQLDAPIKADLLETARDFLVKGEF